MLLALSAPIPTSRRLNLLHSPPWVSLARLRRQVRDGDVADVVDAVDTVAVANAVVHRILVVHTHHTRQTHASDVVVTITFGPHALSPRRSAVSAW